MAASASSCSTPVNEDFCDRGQVVELLQGPPQRTGAFWIQHLCKCGGNLIFSGKAFWFSKDGGIDYLSTRSCNRRRSGRRMHQSLLKNSHIYQVSSHKHLLSPLCWIHSRSIRRPGCSTGPLHPHPLPAIVSFQPHIPLTLTTSLLSTHQKSRHNLHVLLRLLDIRHMTSPLYPVSTLPTPKIS